MTPELLELLQSDIYTDAPEYAERVAKVKALVAKEISNQRKQESKTCNQFRDMAKSKWTDEGQIEIDDGAIVSISDDGGAYVAAWVWIDGEVCRTCGAVYDGYGDGYDGECPGADKSAEAEEAEEARESAS